MLSGYAQPPMLFTREGPRFTRVEPGEDRAWLAEAHCDRTAAFGDLDGDGDVDLVVAGLREPLRILRNDNGTSFTDVTATALPTLAGGSGGVLRGRGLAVADIDGNGKPEIVIGSDEALDDGNGNTVRSSRILWNVTNGTITFEFNEPFEPSFAVDTGEANAILIGDLDFDGLPGIVYITESLPGLSDSESGVPGQGVLTRKYLRFFNWNR